MNSSTSENDIETVVQEVQKILEKEAPFDETSLLIKLDQAQLAKPDNPELANLRTAIINHSYRIRAFKKLSDVKSKCTSLWEQEQALMKDGVNSTRILEECYETALRIAEQAHEEYPEFLPLDGLRNDAQIKYNLARRRYQKKITVDSLHNYQELMSRLEEEPDKDRLITWRDERGNLIDSIRVKDAIMTLTKNAQVFAHNKSQAYLAEAENHLLAHQPRLACDAIEKSKALYLLPSEDEMYLKSFDESHVQPELKKLKEAEQLLQQAQLVIEPEKGLELFEKALEIFPWISGVDEVRKSIISRAQASLLIKAEILLNEKKYREAKSVLEVLPADSNRQRLYENLSAQINQERSIRIIQWKQSLVDRRKQLNAYFLASLATSILVICLLIVGGTFILLGQVSPGIIYSLSSAIPAAVTKVLVDTYAALRKEQQLSLEKTSYEIDLENRILDEKHD
jgi:hypothetical protein